MSRPHFYEGVNQMKDRNNQNDEQELIGVQEQLDLHTEVLNNILPFLPPEIRAQAEAKLGEQKKLESDGAIHAKVDAVHSDVLETKSLLGELKSTVEALTNVVANLSVKEPEKQEHNPPENKTPENKEPKDDKKPDEKKPDEKVLPESPEISLGDDAPVYFFVRKRGGRVIRRLMKSKPVQK